LGRNATWTATRRASASGCRHRHRSASADELGITVFEVEPTAGGSDGNFAAALGVPTLDALGPVSTDVCSRQETMDIASLADRGALFAGIVQRLGTMGTR
jgi:glutamate carboxypeptidase